MYENDMAVIYSVSQNSLNFSEIQQILSYSILSCVLLTVPLFSYLLEICFGIYNMREIIVIECKQVSAYHFWWHTMNSVGYDFVFELCLLKPHTSWTVFMISSALTNILRIMLVVLFFCVHVVVQLFQCIVLYLCSIIIHLPF